MSLLSAKDAANLAYGVYRGQSATTLQGVMRAAEKSIATGEGIGEVTDITPKTGLVGESGAFIKETSGFGMVLERGASVNRELIVVFRGTVSGFDWLSNFNVGFDRGPDGSMIHAGFNQIYRSLAHDLRATIGRANPQRAHFVGHSLGGALASIAASEYAGIHKKPSYLYTFGAPRVGSLGLRSTLRTNLPARHVKRVYSVSDPVPMLPLLPFCHYDNGSTGLSGRFPLVTGGAHSMLKIYIPDMTKQGWPDPIAIPNQSDPDYWLDMAEQSSGIMSAAGYLFLGKALQGLMRVLNVLGIAVGVGVTILDHLIVALRQAVLIKKKMADMTWRFVKLALKMAGRAGIAAAVTVSDLTTTFLTFVFDKLFMPVKIAANLATRVLS